MKCRFNTTRYGLWNSGFSLIETMAALTILSIISVAILVIINRSMASASDSIIRMRAFEVARENMEILLTSESISESVEYGHNEKYPEVKWQTAVEAFFEPVTSQMWIQGVCSAEYVDSAGEEQKVELTNWLTNLTAKDALKMLQLRHESGDTLDGHIIGSLEEAAEYLGVDKKTILAWEAAGMVKSEDGRYVTDFLDLYKKYDGNPPEQEKQEVANDYEELKQEAQQRREKEDRDKADDETSDDKDDRGETDDERDVESGPDEQQESEPEQADERSYCGYTLPELMDLYSSNPGKFWKLMWECEDI